MAGEHDDSGSELWGQDGIGLVRGRGRWGQKRAEASFQRERGIDEGRRSAKGGAECAGRW